MTDLVVRDARLTDQDAIRDVTMAAYEQFSQYSQEMWLEYKTNILATLADTAPAEQIVAERGGKIVGTVLLYPAGDYLDAAEGTTFTREYPEVRLLAVVPPARRQGIARVLVEECIARARRAGVMALSLHTLDVMPEAMRLYERMGFVRTPDTDIDAGPDFIIKGYRYKLG